MVAIKPGSQFSEQQGNCGIRISVWTYDATMTIGAVTKQFPQKNLRSVLCSVSLVL